MKEKPILFSGPMVEALLNTKPNTWPPEPIDPSKPHKWQTRRVVKPRYKPGEIGFEVSRGMAALYILNEEEHIVREENPPHMSGDILWVREKWHVSAIGCGGGQDMVIIAYAAGGESKMMDVSPERALYFSGKGLERSPLFMPHDAARITLEVKNVRIERLQDIKSDDVKAEGRPKSYTSWGVEIKYVGPYCESCSYSTSENKVCSPYYCYEQACFSAFWNKLNAKRGYGWASNPWVWVYEFMRVT
jgi:hypothetical protein